MSRFDDLDPVIVATAAILITHTSVGSASMVSRRLDIDYPAACRVMDALETAGVVGPPIAGGARAVLIDNEIAAAARIAVWLTNQQ